MGACCELIFAPIDEMFPDDAPLVPSGFRIIPLDSKPVESCFFVSDFSPTDTVVHIWSRTVIKLI